MARKKSDIARIAEVSLVYWSGIGELLWDLCESQAQFGYNVRPMLCLNTVTPKFTLKLLFFFAKEV